MAAPRKLSELFYEIRARTEFLQRDLQDTEKQFGKLSSFIKANPVAAVASLATAIAGVAIAGAKAAAALQTSMAKVNTVLTGTTTTLGELSDGLKKQFAALPVDSLNDLSEALYQILSSGIDASKGLEVLEVSTKAAIGGFTDTRTVADALTSVLNAYKGTNLDAATAADVMAKAVANGKIEFAQLSSSIGSVVGIASSFGTSIQDITAVLTTLSLGGIKTAEGVTGLRSAFINIIRPSEKFLEQFPNLAEAFSKTRLQRDGFVRFLLDFQKESKGSAQALSLLFNDTQAYAAVVGLLKDNGQELAKQLGEMSNASGSVDAAFSKATNTAEAMWKLVKNNLSIALIELGEVVLPLVTAGLSALVDVLERFNGVAAQNEAADNIAVLITGIASSVDQSESSFQRALEAAAKLNKAVKAGEVDLKKLDSNTLGKLSSALDALARSKAFTNIKVADFQRLGKELRELATQTFGYAIAANTAEKAAQAEAVRVQALADAKRKQAEAEEAAARAKDNASEANKKAEQEAKAALAESIRAVAEANKLLDGVEQKAVDQRTRVGRALIAIGEQTVATMRQLILDAQAQLRSEGFGDAAIEVLTTTEFGVKNVLKNLDVAKQGLAELDRQNAKSAEKRADNAEKRAKIEQDAQIAALRAGRAIEDIGNLVLTAASSFGILSDEAEKALEAVLDVGVGIARMFNPKDRAGGGAQIATGLLSLASQAFGKDAGAEERRKQHAENLAALKEIAKHTGDLLGVSTSGGDIAGIRSAVRDLLTSTGSAGGFRRFGASGPLEGINEAAVLERATGLSFKEIEALAKSLGIALNGTKQSYVDFLNALTQLDLEAFTQGFSGQLRRLELEARLDPAAFDGLEGLIKRLAVLAGPDGAPAIAKALEGLDLSTAGGRADAIAKLTETLRNLSSLDVADLGGLSLDQFIEEILAAIEKLREAEPVARTAAEKFGDALELIGLEVELGGLKATDRLAKVKAAFQESFGEAFADIDFGSADSFRASIEAIIAGLTADGKLTDEERALAAALRELLGAFEATLPEAEKFTDAMDVLRDQFEITGADARERFAGLAAALGEAFPSIAEILAGIDLGKPGDLDALRKRAADLFASLATDGVTEAEQAVIDAIKKVLAAAGDAAGEIADEVAAQVVAEAAARARILAGAETRIRLDDVTDPAEQLRIRLAALTLAFPELAAVLGDLDVTTQAGRDALEAWIRSIGNSPEALEALAAAMGITVDELLDALFQLEDGADAAQEAVQSLASKLQTAFNEIDFDLELRGITDPLERLTRTVAGIVSVLPEIRAALAGVNLGSESGRAEAEKRLVALGASTTDPAVRDAILRILAQIRGFTATVGDAAADAAAGGAADASRTLQGTPSITAIQADRWLDLARTQVTLLRQIADNTAGDAQPAAGADGTGADLLRDIAATLATIPAAISPAVAREIAAAADLLREIARTTGRPVVIEDTSAPDVPTAPPPSDPAVLVLLREIVAALATPGLFAPDEPPPVELPAVLTVARDPAVEALLREIVARTPDTGEVTVEGDPAVPVLLRQVVDNTKALAALFPRIDPALLLRPPPAPAVSTTGGLGVVFRVEQNNYFDGALGTDDRARALEVTDELLRRIDEGLARLRDRHLLSQGVTAR